MNLNDNTTELEAILQMVNELPQAGGDGVSVQADWNQTDATAPDFIKNKPFGDTGDTLRWDGNIENRPTIAEEYRLVSRNIIPSETLAAGGVVTIALNGVERSVGYDSENLQLADGFVGVFAALVDGAEESPVVICLYEGGAASFGAPAGIYFLGAVIDATSCYVSSFKINNYTGFPSKINKKYLPDEVLDGLQQLNNEKADKTTVEELFTSVSNGKALVASAITDKGVDTASDATFAVMAANIGQIETGVDCTSGFLSLSVVEIVVGANTVADGAQAIDYLEGLVNGRVCAIALLDNPTTNNQLVSAPGSTAKIESGYDNYRVGYRYNTSGVRLREIALYADYNAVLKQGSRYKVWVADINTTDYTPY